MKLAKYVANLGYGSRREVVQLLHDRRVTRRDGSPLSQDDGFAHDDVLVNGEPLDPAPGALIMFHKPVGYVCSAQDAGPVIYDLLPPRFRERSPAMSPAGRLDRDTSGLLLLTDDGELNHRITSPRNHLPRVYEARLASSLRGDEAGILASGRLILASDPTPLKPAIVEVCGPVSVRITLTEGRYHQVRRMFAAVGNHVEALHRRAIGRLELGTLAPGEWRVLDMRDRMQLLES